MTNPKNKMLSDCYQNVIKLEFWRKTIYSKDKYDQTWNTT